jgi:hypothetical protein
MLRSTPRIEVNQRSREARLRLERVERLIAVVMTTRSLLVPRNWWLGCQAAACAKPIGPRPNRPNRSRSVTADDMASGPRRRPAPVSAGAVETIRPS